MAMNDYNIAKVLEDALLKDLKKELIRRLTDKIIEEIKQDIKPVIEAEVEKVTLQGVDKLKDMMNIREEINVYLKWEEK